MTLEEYADASDNLVKILQEENAIIKKQNKELQEKIEELNKKANVLYKDEESGFIMTLAEWVRFLIPERKRKADR